MSPEQYGEQPGYEHEQGFVGGMETGEDDHSDYAEAYAAQDALESRWAEASPAERQRLIEVANQAYAAAAAKRSGETHVPAEQPAAAETVAARGPDHSEWFRVANQLQSAYESGSQEEIDTLTRELESLSRKEKVQ